MGKKFLYEFEYLLYIEKKFLTIKTKNDKKKFDWKNFEQKKWKIREKFFFFENFSFYASIIILIFFVVFCLFQSKFIFCIYLHLIHYKINFFLSKTKNDKKKLNLKIMKNLKFFVIFCSDCEFQILIFGRKQTNFGRNFFSKFIWF